MFQFPVNRAGTGPIVRPQTAPLPAEEQAPTAPPRTPSRPLSGDTAQLRAPQQPQPPEEVSFDELGGELVDGLNEHLNNSALDKGRGLLNAPGAVLHTIQLGEMLIRNPGAAAEALQNALDNPLEAAQAAGEAIGEVKDAAEALTTTAGVVKDSAGNTLKNVREQGVVKGVRQSAADATSLGKKHAADIKEHFRSDSGAGLSNVAKEATEQVAGLTEKRVSQAMLRELYKDPDLAPKGLLAGLRRTVGKVTDAVDAVTGKALDFADNLANRAADAMAGNAVGRRVLDALDYMNPARRVSPAALEAATKAGAAEGVQAATEGVARTLEKAGHTVVTDAAGGISKVVSSAGKEIAVEGLQGATKAGMELAAKEAAQIGTKTAAKGLGRFAPGVNVAIAAYDTYHAAEVWRDPNSTGWQKGMASVTAVGSVLAATNIPIVSQVGAGVSLVTSVLENVSPQMMADGARAVGRATVKAAQAVGGAARAAAGAVTEGAKSAVKSVGNFIGGLFG